MKEILRPAAERGSRESFSDFVLDLPELPPELLELLRDLAAEKNRYADQFLATITLTMEFLACLLPWRFSGH